MSDEPILDPEVTAEIPIEADPADVIEQRIELPPADDEEVIVDDGADRIVDDRPGLGRWDL